MWLKADSTGREAMLTGVATLLKNLVKAGAWHADLNLKNIYIVAHGPDIVPYVLDVDRVSFPGAKTLQREISIAWHARPVNGAPDGGSTLLRKHWSGWRLLLWR